MTIFRIYLILVLFVSLTQNSLSAQTDSNCAGLLNKLVSKVATFKQGPLKTYTSKDLFRKKDLSDFLIYLKEEQNFSKEEFQLAKNSAILVFGKVNKDKLYSLVSFSKTVNSKKRLILLSDFTPLLDLDKPKGLYKKFFKTQKTIDKETQKEFNKLKKELQVHSPNLSSKEVDNQTYKKLALFRKNYEKMNYGCKANTWTTERNAAKDFFVKFKLGIGLTSSILGYSYQNTDKFKEDKRRWAKVLGYELVFSIASSYISAGIVSGKTNSIIKKSGLKYLNSRLQSFVDWGLYSYLFGASKDKARKEVDKILASKEKQKSINELITYLDQDYFYTNFKRTFKKSIGPFLNQLGISTLNLPHIKGVDWSNLKESDLENKLVLNSLVNAVMAKEYESNKGNIIQMGTIGADRYAYHAAYGALLLPRDMAVDLYILHILCMGGLNPKAALLKAIAVFSVNKIIFDQLYYWTRGEVINQ